MSKLSTGAINAQDFLKADFSTFEAEEPEFVLPTAENLDAGRYKSTLDHFDVIEENGEVTAIDCFHKLEDNDGNVVRVRFRIFASKGGINDLKDVFQGYRLHSFAEAIGIEETVVLASRKGSNYLFIKTREKAKRVSSLTRALNKAKIKSPPPEIDEGKDEDYDDFLIEDDD